MKAQNRLRLLPPLEIVDAKKRKKCHLMAFKVYYM